MSQSSSSSEIESNMEVVPLVVLKKRLKEEVLIGSSYERVEKLRAFKEKIRKDEILKWSWKENQKEIDDYINQYHEL